jgi:hypothetical protein
MAYVFVLVLAIISVGLEAITVYDRPIHRTQVGGYMDMEFISDDTVSTFRAHRLVIQVGAQLAENVLFNSEVEYEYGGAVTNDSSTNQKGEIKIEQAWVDYKTSDWLTIRTGMILVPVGRLNNAHDSDLRDYTARSLVNTYVIPTTWVDTGVGGWGTVDIQDAEVGYEVYVVNGLDHENTFSETKGLRGMRPNFKTDTDTAKAFVARMNMSPTINSSFGFSTYYGSSQQLLTGLDTVYTRGPWQAHMEAAWYSDGYNNNANGYTVGARYNMAAWIGLPIYALARIEWVDLVASDDQKGHKNRLSLGMAIRPTSTLVYKMDYAVQTQADEASEGILSASVAVGF